VALKSKVLTLSFPEKAISLKKSKSHLAEDALKTHLTNLEFYVLSEEHGLV